MDTNCLICLTRGKRTDPAEDYYTLEGTGVETTQTDFSDRADTQTYRVGVTYNPGGGELLWSPICSQKVTVTWSN